MLQFLVEHAVRYEFVYRHRWRNDDLIVWDNRCLMHLAVSDYDLRGDVRHMLRTSLSGGEQGYHYDSRAAEERVPAAARG